MDFSLLLVVALTLGVLCAAVTNRVTLDVLGIAVLAVLILSGIIGIEEALSGFSNQAVVALAGLYVIGEGLTRTGALEFVARVLVDASGGSPKRLLFTLCTTAALFSALVSDTAVVLVFMPITLGLSRELGISPSRLLIPVAYSALFGGTLTLVGSSVNLLTSGAAVQSGADPIGVFTMTPYALPTALIGIAIMSLFAGRLLPERPSVTSTLYASNAREYVTELAIGPTSSLIGKALETAFEGSGVEVLFVVRGEEILYLPQGEIVLREGDIVTLQGHAGQLADFQAKLGLKMVGHQKFDPRRMTFFELAVSPHSRMIGRRIEDLYLARDYDLSILAVLRRNHHVQERASQCVLSGGDLLLVCGTEDSRAKIEASTDFYLLLGAHKLVVLRQHARRALWVLAAVVASFIVSAAVGSERLSIPLITTLGATAMVITGSLTARRAYRTIDWSLLIFVVGMLALGKGIEKTGLAALCAGAMVDTVSSMGPWALVSGVLLIATLLNQVISPYAVCVLLTPIAIEAARSMGIEDLRPFVLAVAFGGSNAFCTPLGHQVNLMVMGPGGYRYSDFFRLGPIMCLVMWVVVSLGLTMTMAVR